VLYTVDATAGWSVVAETPLDLGPRHHVLRSPLDALLLQTVGASLRPADRVLVLAPDASAGHLLDFAQVTYL